MNRTQLVLELFAPDENGVSRWVSKNELVGRYASLYPTNGNQWMRNRGIKHLNLEKTVIDRVIHWRFNGFKLKQNANRPIKKEIRNQLSKKPCVHTGFGGTNNNPIVIDHKNGRYNDEDVLNVNTQKLDDFQSMCNQANLQKRSYCNNVCVKTNSRFDAKILGYGVSYTEGGEKYEGTCVGCYWYDCLDFKNKISSLK
jgi:hypothetical protein